MKTIKRFKKSVSIWIFILLLSAPVSYINAQGLLPGEGSDKDWNFVITPYIWFSALNGQIGVATVEADFDASFSDIFSNMNIGFMMYGEVRYKRFGLAIDLLTVNLGIEGTRPVTGGAVNAEQKVTFLETSLLYSLVHNEKWSADIHLGVRTWWMNTTMDAERIMDLEPIRVESDLSWVDPIVGMNAVFLPHQKWPLNARFDIGGFGAGSEFTWNLQAGAGYRFAKAWTVLLQYRVLGVDYQEGEQGSPEYFKYNARQFGPLVGFMATF